MFREQPERGEPHPHQPQQSSQARQERRSLNLSVVFEELPLQFLNIKTTERVFFSFILVAFPAILNFIFRLQIH